MRARRRVNTTALFAALLVTAACGRQQSLDTGDAVDRSSDPLRETEQTSVTNPEFALIVARAGERSCTDVTSGRIRMTVGLHGVGQPGSRQVEFDMAFDRAAGRASMSLDLSGIIGDGDDGSGIPSGGGAGVGDLVGTKAEMILDGDTAYIDWPFVKSFLGVKTKWAKLTGNSSGPARGNPAPLGPDGCEPLKMLAGVGADVSEVGTQTIDGSVVTHYRAVVDAARAVEANSGEHRQKLAKFFEKFGDSAQIPVDLWVGTDGIVRKIVFNVEDYHGFDLPAGRELGSGGSEASTGATVTIEFNAIDEPVTIEVPPADEVSQPSIGADGLDGDDGGSAPGGFGD